MFLDKSRRTHVSLNAEEIVNEPFAVVCHDDLIRKGPACT
jgi:hypothetical protein